MPSKNGNTCLKQVITLSDLATLTVQSERSVQRLVKSGVLRLARDRQGRQLKGRFVLGDCVPRVCEHLRDQVTADDPNERLYKRARARKMQALATSEEMRVKLQRGELIDGALVDREVMNVLTAVKNHLLSIPSRLMHQLVGKTDPREINQLVRAEVERALREASEFDMKQSSLQHIASETASAEAPLKRKSQRNNRAADDDDS